MQRTVRVRQMCVYTEKKEEKKEKEANQTKGMDIFYSPIIT